VVRLPAAEVFTLGRSDAPVTLVEFTDLECPFCRRFHLTTFERLKQEFVDTGRVRYVTRDLPLRIHPNARPAAHAARCAGEQGRFWEVRHLLFAGQARVGDEDLAGYARQAGVDAERLRACVTSGRHEDAIRRDVADATSAGVSGTPTFLLGPTRPDGFEGVRLVGAHPYEVFAALIRELLGAR
jgi:protein-disulfide isomerase